MIHGGRRHNHLRTALDILEGFEACAQHAGVSNQDGRTMSKESFSICGPTISLDNILKSWMLPRFIVT
jgi:hypothetical protein